MSDAVRSFGNEQLPSTEKGKMKTFTMADLVRIMRAAAGEDESVNLDQDIADHSFGDLGYDSLAVLETAGRVEREFEVALPEEALASIDTPKDFVEFVENQISASA